MITPCQIKLRLKSWAASTQPIGATDVFIDELCFIDKSRRADLVLANGKLSAFEIKSPADTLARWEGQQRAYLSCFDEVWLCCHSKHLVKALGVTSPVVGVLVVDNSAGMAVVREPGRNRNIDPYNLTGFLWREQLECLAKEYNVDFSKKMLIKDLRCAVAKLPLQVIQRHVVGVLKARYAVK